MSNTAPQEGDLQIWWIPQIGMLPAAFTQSVESVEEGSKTLNLLANYDLYQLDNNIKGDYSNMGGLSVFGSGQWDEWESEDGESIYEYMDTEVEE